MKKKVSIVVVSLNTKVDFLKTLKSILNQKNKNYEIIVVDGMSSDGTLDLVKKYKNKISKTIIEKDAGIYYAMNKGIKISDSIWTIFMNCGDIFYNNKVLKIFNEKNFIDNDIVFGNTIISNKFYKVFIKGKYFSKRTVLMPFCHQSSFVKTKFLKKMKFNTKYKLSADFNLFLKAYNIKKKFVYFNQTISVVKPGGISDIFRHNVINENMIIFCKERSYKNIVKLILIKLIDKAKQLVKYFLPKKTINRLIKLKYNKLSP
jgi:glycosyltransferase involved in cell wall biosynthesis